MGLRRVFGRRVGMNGHPVSDRKLQPVAIDERKPVAFRVVDHHLVGRAATKHRIVALAFGSLDGDLRLEQPGPILVVVGFELTVHEEQRDEPLPLVVRSHCAL